MSNAHTYYFFLFCADLNKPKNIQGIPLKKMNVCLNMKSESYATGISATSYTKKNNKKK